MPSQGEHLLFFLLLLFSCSALSPLSGLGDCSRVNFRGQQLCPPGAEAGTRPVNQRQTRDLTPSIRKPVLNSGTTKVLQRTVEATVGASGSAQAVMPSDGDPGSRAIGGQGVSYSGPLTCAERPAPPTSALSLIPFSNRFCELLGVLPINSCSA